MLVSHLRDRAAWMARHVLVAFFGLALVACGSSGDSTSLAPDGGLPDGGGGGSATTKELTLLLTGKVAGSLEPCG